MPIKSKNLSANAEFARHFWVTNIDQATGSTVTTASQAALIVPFRMKVESVTVRTRATSSASVVDVQEAGTSILSAAISAATTASTNVVGAVSDSDIAAAAVLNVVLTKGSTEAAYVSVIVQYRPYMGSSERYSRSLADEAQ